MKKKLVILSIICALTFAMCACGSSEDTANTNEETTSVESTDATENTDAAESAEDANVAADTESAADETAAATGTLTFDIPEGFVESEENYYSCEDTTKLSNINYLALENDGSFDSINSEILMASVEAQLEEAYGEDLTLTLLEESSYEVDGCRAFNYAFEYEMSGTSVRQLQCIIETADELHFITFTDINDEGFYDTFKAAADTIRFE